MKTPLSKDDLKFLNARGRDELIASNAYRYASTCLMKRNLEGFVKFFRAESADELTHRTKLEEFCNAFNEELDMPAIPAISFSSEEVKDILEYLLKMEYDLLQAYELGCEDADRWAVKKLCLDMVDIQIDGVGAINDLIAELENTEIGEMNLRLLQA